MARRVQKRRSDAETPSQGDLPRPASAPAAVEDHTTRLTKLALRWQPDPRLFVIEALHAIPDAWQDDVLQAIKDVLEHGESPERTERFKIAMKACKGPGKTCILAWIILWFLFCFKLANILCTSITFENLRDGLWKELAYWISKSDLLKALLVQDSERLYVRGYKETWFCAARTWPKDADKTKQADTLAGLHARHTMIVVDEGGGIPVGVLAAALAHHSTQDPTSKEVHFTIMAGNPTDISGSLGWACTTDGKNWWVKEITGDPDDPKRAPRIDVKWAREQIEKFGADNPWVLVNVFGKFPPVGTNKLLGPDHVRAAMAVSMAPHAWQHHPRIMTLDVARSLSRDRSVICRRQGPVVFPFRVYRLDDSNELAGQVALEFSRWPAQIVIIDAVGIGGPVADQLRAIGLPVIMFNGGLPARDKRFLNRRAEVYWTMAHEIKGQGGVPGLALPNFLDLIPELTEPEIDFTNKGQISLESKDDMLARGLASPDLADALAMSFAEKLYVPNMIPGSTLAALGTSMCKHEFDPFEMED